MRNLKFLIGAALVFALAAAPATAQQRETFDPNAAAGPSATLSPNPWSPSEVVLYDNGPFETAPGESLLENITLGVTTLGLAAQGDQGNALADDFDVTGDGWTIDTITGFTYQSFAPNTTTVAEVNVRIYDGDPNGGGTVFFDGSAGCLSSTTETNVFRFSETTVDQARAIFTATCTVGMDFPAGTYWAEFGFVGSLAFSGPWAPPVTILGTTPVPGANGQQFFGGVWQPAADGGTGDILAMPFVVEGDPLSIFVPPQEIPTLGQWGLIALTLLLMALGVYTLSRRRQQNA